MSIKRSEISPMPEYFDRYINKCDNVSILEAIQTSIDELDHFPVAKWKALGDSVYAPGKWTVKDILQHLIDTERVFAYRAMAFARNETQAMPVFPEELYAEHSGAQHRTLESLIAELRLVHLSVQALFESFRPEVLLKMCKGFKGEYTVASVGFILPGHQRWHMQVLEERYYPLLDQ